MSNFANLKKSSSTSLQTLNKKLEEIANKDYSKKDDTFWSLTVDEQGNGYAVIRFLPAPEGEDDPFVRLFTHGFKGPTGQWYIENSLNTLNQPDPCSEYNSKLWATDIEANKEIARKQKRKLNFISNIYVVKDPKNPQNEGKVFKYRYGKAIFEKITDAMNPPEGFEDEQPFDPFNLWEGANFKLKQRKKDGWPNFDNSEFETPSVLGKFDDAKLEEIYNSEYSLKEVIDPKNFKSYDELKARLEKVLGLTGEKAESVGGTSSARSEKTATSKATKEETSPWDSDDTDDDLQEFLDKLD